MAEINENSIDTATAPAPQNARETLERAYFLALAFVCGMCVMAVEMAGQRALVPHFGSTTYVWTNVIGVILAALSAGYWIGGRIADKAPRPKALLLIVLFAGLLCFGAPLLVHKLGGAMIPEGLKQESAFRVVYLGSFLTTLVLLAPPVFLLAMVTPFIIRLMVRQAGDAGSAAGKVYAFSTVGSIAGTFLPTLVLIPWLGSARTLVAAAAVLAGFAALGLVLFRSRGGAVAAGVLALAAAASAAFADPSISGSAGTLMEEETAFQYVRVHEKGDRLMLSLNEGLETYHSFMVRGSSLTGGTYCDYLLTAPLQFDPLSRPVLRVYVAGLAAAVISRQMHHFLDGLFTLEIDGSEIDEGVLRAGADHFGLDGPVNRNLKAFPADARVHLASARGKYDLILVDAFAGQMYVPFQLATREFFAEVRDRLTDGGTAWINVCDFERDGPLVGAMTRTMSDVFGPGSVRRLKVPDGINYLLIAGRGRAPDFAARNLTSAAFLSKSESSPLSWWVKLGSGLISPAPAGGALSFTDDRAPVEALMDRAFRRAAASAF